MGLSFHEMQAAAQEMSLRAVFDEDLSNYTLCDDGRYEVYTEYTDDAVSEVDKHKNITVNEEQCNLTQEENSQYVPFKLPRYWDGVDLMTKLIQFHYVNINGGSGVSTAVNVRFNDSYIICGWLINKSVTAVAGDVTFEITATGTNEKSADYRWRTRPNGKFTVLEALSYDGIIEPSDDWYAGFVKSMQEYTTKAAESARSAQDYADQSKSNLDQVTQITETFTTNAQEVKETAINEINNAKVSGVNAVEAAATEIVNDREKITENANNISSLKGDLVDVESKFGNSFDDKDDTLYITDKNGNIICKIDKNGIQSVAFLDSNRNQISGNVDGIINKYEDSFYITDASGNVIMKVDKNGVTGVGINEKMTSPYAGMTMISIGDSLSSHDKWQAPLAEWTGMHFDKDVNINGKDGHYAMSIGGTAIRPTTSNSILKRVQDAKYYNPDVIIIYAGQNDVLGDDGRYLGTIDDDPYSDRTCETESQNFYANYMGMLNILLEDCPNAQIILVNWLPMWESDTDQAHTHKEWVRKAKSDAVLEIAKKYGLVVVDQWYHGGVNHFNAPQYYPNEGNVHCNPNGYKQTAMAIYRTII